MAASGGTDSAGAAAEAPSQEQAAGQASSSAGWEWQPWQWQQGRAWGSYAGADWQGTGYGSWSWSWAPGWSDSAWKNTAWAGDSDGQQKTEHQQSWSRGSVGNSGGGGEDEAAGDASRRQSASTMEDETWAGGEGTASLDEDGGSSNKTTAPKASGKEFIPEYDGSGPMREYQRRVKLFEMSTGIDPSFRAQKLMEKLTGNAWLATESIPLESLKHPDGVSRLLDHLWKELEPLEFLRTFQTLADFYKGFRRSRGQEFVAYDMEFRRHGQRLEEIGAGLSGVTRAYWFLEKAGLSSELRKQVVAAAGGQYDYAKLRSAVMAIVPQVNKEDEHHGSGQQQPHSGNRQWRKAAKVHATTQDATAEDVDDDTGAGSEDGQVPPELLEEELHVLLTQAARKRAQVEKARGFSSGNSNGKGGSKGESAEARTKRIAELKQKMPCSACKANGKTVYGHWHGDSECPYNRKVAKGAGSNVMAVVEDELSDSDEDYMPSSVNVFLATSRETEDETSEYWCASAVSRHGHEHDFLLALSDTCCARSVVGEKWAKAHMAHLHKAGVDVYIVDEARPFRFGAGPRIASQYSVVFPVHVGGGCAVPWLRVSVVDQDIPLLLSKGALKALGAKLDLGRATLEFAELETEVALIETQSGLCGFEINKLEGMYTGSLDFPPGRMLEGEMEVSLGDLLEDREVQESEVHVCPGVGSAPNPPKLPCELLAEKFLEQKNFSYKALQEVVEHLPEVDQTRQRGINGGNRKGRRGVMAGLWAHGGFCGVAKTSSKFPVTIQYINNFMREKVDLPWTSFVVLKNVMTNIHTDAHNATDSLTATVTFGQFDGGELWVEGSDEINQGRPAKKGKSGRKLPCTNVDTREKPYFLNPKRKHATQPWTGTRWCLSCYTARSEQQMDGDMKKSLGRLGFPLREVPQTRTFGSSNVVCSTSSNHQEPLKTKDGVESPCLITPHAVDGRSVAQPQSDSLQPHDSQGRGEDGGDGEQVHHAEAQGGVRARHPHPNKPVDGGGAEARRRAPQVDLEYGQAQEAAVAPSGRVEENGCRSPQGDLREGGVPRSRKGARQALGALESAPVGDGDRHVGHRSAGRPATRGCVLGDSPMPDCNIPLVVRTNRLTKEDFFGCVRFPLCTQTLPLTYGGRPTKEVQDQMNARKDSSEQVGKKGGKGENRKGGPKRTLVGSRPAPESSDEPRATSSDGSWVRTGRVPIEETTDTEKEAQLFNANLTPEEMRIIHNMRKAKMNEEK